MKQLNADCLIYICKFLTFKDKINFIKTCKIFYNIGPEIFRDCVVKYCETKFTWINKYKPIVYTDNIDNLETIDKNIPCHLNISYTKLCPTHLSFLNSNLQYLNISDCQLSTLPKSIKDLCHLTRLNCSYNNLDVLPNLPNSLTCLYANNNKIKQVHNLPTNTNLDFNNLTQIHVPANCTTLTIANNLLTKLGGGKNLVYINANNNRLKQISFTDSTRLKCIKILHNNINEIALPNSLEKLYIEYNQLTSLNIPSCCKIVKASYNLLTHISGSTNELEYLDIGDNLVTCIQELPNCIELYCHGNNITTLIPNMYPNLVSLSIYNNPIEYISMFPNLEYIYINLHQNVYKCQNLTIEYIKQELFNKNQLTIK